MPSASAPSTTHQLITGLAYAGIILTLLFFLIRFDARNEMRSRRSDARMKEVLQGTRYEPPESTGTFKEWFGSYSSIDETLQLSFGDIGLLVRPCFFLGIFIGAIALSRESEKQRFAAAARRRPHTIKGPGFILEEIQTKRGNRK